MNEGRETVEDHHMLLSKEFTGKRLLLYCLNILTRVSSLVDLQATGVRVSCSLHPARRPMLHTYLPAQVPTPSS